MSEVKCSTTHHAGCACHEARRDAERDALRAQLDAAEAALKGVLAVADRKTKEFDAARDCLARMRGGEVTDKRKLAEQWADDPENQRKHRAWMRPSHIDAFIAGYSAGVEAAAEDWGLSKNGELIAKDILALDTEDGGT